MASSKEQIRQSDVTFWGIAALICGAAALLLANLSALLPPNMITGLHSTRLDGGNLNHLRMQVSALEEETNRIRNENGKLMTMLSIAGEDQNAVTRRIGAIESTLPVLLENSAGGPGIDESLLTSGIGEPRKVTEVEGGSVAVSTKPMPSAETEGSMALPKLIMPDAPSQQIASTKPRIIAAPPSAFGIALGPQVTLQDAFVAWKDITNKAGPLLLGLGPLLSGNAGADQQRLVAGPISDYAQAEQICVRMIRIGISCLPVPYAGHALPD